MPWWGHAAVADVDGDGYADLIDAEGVLHGGPDGPTRGVPLEGVAPDTFFRAWAVGDLDGDGLGDVVVSASTTDLPPDAPTSDTSLRLYLAADRGPDRWPARWAILDGVDGPGSDGFRGHTHGEALTVTDVDGDGVSELVLLSRTTEFGPIDLTLTILGDLVAPTGPRVLAARPYRSPTAPSLHTLGDLDGDGDDEVLFVTYDLLMIDAEPDPAAILTRLPPTLEVPLPGREDLVPLVGLDDLHATVGDFDGDGLVDIAAAYGWDGLPVGRVAVWYGTSLRTADPAPPEWGEPEPRDPWSAPPAGGCGCTSTSHSGSLLLLVTCLLGLAGRRAVDHSRRALRC